jgi:cell division protein ZipA
MPELRIILLVAGVVFIAVLAAIEWWRSRGTRPLATLSSREESPEERPDLRADPRGSSSLPEINMGRDSRIAFADTLPVIDLGEATKSSGDSRGIAVSDDVAIDTPQPQPAAPAAPQDPPPPADTAPQESTSTQSILRAHDTPFLAHGVEISEVRMRDTAESPVPGLDNPLPRGPQITLAWPGEAERRIVTMRVMPRTEPRFAGRALRQAFSSAGFWHGPLDIYHLPDEKGRVILSAAALAQPGTFDPSLMDSMRFSGVNLFAVLPGPLSDRETFDELVHAARQLAERLDGQMIDQHGDELTPPRIARLRQSIEAPPAARAAGES